MRLTEPRIPALDPADWSKDQANALGREAAELQENLGTGESVLNLLRTMVHHPALCKSWKGFSGHLLFETSLPPRDREIAILRIGWLCKSGYELGQHILIAEQAGLVKKEIIAITEGAEAPGWADHERALILAADELHADAFISDATYAKLASHYDTQQIMDLVFTVGQYNMVSMALNTFGVQLDAGVPDYQEYIQSR